MRKIFDAVMKNDFASLAIYLRTITDPIQFDSKHLVCHNLCNSRFCEEPKILLTPLALAERKKHAECISLLINRIIELGGETESLKTAVDILINKRQTNELRVLLAHLNAAPIPPEFFGLAMMAAAKNGRTEHLRVLLEHPMAEHISPELLGNTVIAATSNGETVCLHMLLAHPSAKHFTPELLGNAVIGAATNGNPVCLHILLAHPNANKITPELLGNAVIGAATNGNPECLRILLADPSASKIIPEQLGPAVIGAATNGNPTCLRILLMHLPENNINIPPELLGNAVIAATKNGQTDVLRILIGHARTLKINLDLNNALLIAVEKEEAACLSLLIEEGADPNSAANGNTAIALAAKSGNVTSMARLLLEEKTTLSDDDIELLKPYKPELFETIAYFYFLAEYKEKAVDTLLRAYTNKDSNVGRLVRKSRGLTECSMERGTLGFIGNFLEQHGISIENSAVPQPSTAASGPEKPSTASALPAIKDVLPVTHFGSNSLTKQEPSKKIPVGQTDTTTSTATASSESTTVDENPPAATALHKVL